MNLDLLKRIVDTPGVSGFEEEIQELVADTLRPFSDEVRTDRMGNVIALRRSREKTTSGSRPVRLALAAHCDEIGMMVKHIDADGFVRFQRIGGLYTPALPSQRVVIHDRKAVQGVIVPDLATKEIVAPEDLFIDLGLSKKEVEELVQVGDPITFAQEFVQLNEKVVMGRNFDDRIGTFCLLEAMRRVDRNTVDVYAVSTVQEEVGVRGMPTAAYAIEPDLGIALDGSLAQGPYAKAHQHTCRLGEGTGIYLMDNLTIGNRRLLKFLFDQAGKYGIPCQKNIGGGTDASALQRTKTGSLATTIGAPVRYMHSTVQLAHLDDIEATIELLRVVMENGHEMAEHVL